MFGQVLEAIQEEEPVSLEERGRERASEKELISKLLDELNMYVFLCITILFPGKLKRSEIRGHKTASSSSGNRKLAYT